MNFFHAVTAAGYAAAPVPGIITDGLVFNMDATNPASYPGTGSLVYDTAGTNSGTLTNGASWETSGGKHFEFDGLDDYIELGSITSANPLSLYGLDEVTVEIWIRPDGTGDAFQRVIDKSNGGSGANGWSIYYTNFEYVQFQTNGATPPGQIDVTANEWQQVVIRINFATNQKTYFRNGITNIVPTTETGTPSAVTTNARIGTWNHATGREWNGGIGAVRIYNRGLLTSEIVQNFNAKRGKYGI